MDSGAGDGGAAAPEGGAETPAPSSPGSAAEVVVADRTPEVEQEVAAAPVRRPRPAKARRVAGKRRRAASPRREPLVKRAKGEGLVRSGSVDSEPQPKSRALPWPLRFRRPANW